MTGARIPELPWRPRRFTFQERMLALADVSSRTHNLLHSMFKEPTPEPNGRDELQTLRNELNCIDEQLHNTVFFIEILTGLLDKAELQHSLLVSTRSDKYQECQALAEKRAEGRNIYLPLEIISKICYYSIPPVVTPSVIPKYLRIWGSILSHTVRVRVEEDELVATLTDPSLSKYRKLVWISNGAQGHPLKLVQDAHQRGEICSIVQSVYLYHYSVQELRDKREELLQIGDTLFISGLRRGILLPERHVVWDVGAAPKIQEVSCPLCFLPTLGNLLDNVTSLEVVLPVGDYIPNTFQRSFQGLVLPSLKRFGVVGGNDMTESPHLFDHEPFHLPSVADLAIRHCTAKYTLLVLEKLKCDSIRSLEILPLLSRPCGFTPDLMEYICKHMGSLTKLTFRWFTDYDGGSEVSAVATDHIIRGLLPEIQGDTPLPHLKCLELPYHEETSAHSAGSIPGNAFQTYPHIDIRQSTSG